MASLTPGECYTMIYNAACTQVNRLLAAEGHYCGTKHEAIQSALERLREAIHIKNPDCVEVLTKTRVMIPTLNTQEVARLNLNTIEQMVNARISIWEREIAPWTSSGGMDHPGQPEGYYRKRSLREALNISRYNFINVIFKGSGMGPLWGKSKALKEFEATIQTGFSNSTLFESDTNSSDLA